MWHLLALVAVAFIGRSRSEERTEDFAELARVQSDPQGIREGLREDRRMVMGERAARTHDRLFEMPTERPERFMKIRHASRQDEEEDIVERTFQRLGI